METVNVFYVPEEAHNLYIFGTQSFLSRFLTYKTSQSIT